MFTSILTFIANLLSQGPTQSQKPQAPGPPQPSYGQQPHKFPRPHYPGSHQDLNQISQSNEYYVNLRARANDEGDAMARCFEQSHRAYADGSKAEAKTLSNKGKEHQSRMETLNKEASDWIFAVFQNSRPGEINLHGLYVKEAITHTDRAIEGAKRRGDHELRLIVGKGLHSKGGAARIKPAIEDLMQKHRLQAALDPHNCGILVVRIDSSISGGFRPDQIVRWLERDDGCVTM